MEEPQRTNQSPQAHVHITHVGWMYMALVFISFAAVIGTGLGVYYLQQGQIDSLTQSLNEKHSAATGKIKEVTPTVQGTRFERKTVPFTFEHPSDWVAVTDKPFLEDSRVNEYDNYAITLYVPGTFDEETPLGGTTAYKGAVFKVIGAKTPLKTIDDISRQAGFASAHKDVSKVTMASLPALRSTSVFEGPQVLQTEVIRDGWNYSVSMTHAGELKDSQYLQAYNALVKSFAFK